jgi:hypothetical protein
VSKDNTSKGIPLLARSVFGGGETAAQRGITAGVARHLLRAPIVLGWLLGLAQPAPGYADESACAQIRSACISAGFTPGAAQSGNGLQLDCMQPILRGTAQPSGSNRALPDVAPLLVQACRDVHSAAPPTAAAALAGQAATNLPLLSYVDGSTRKIGQLIGDVDKQTHQPTLSRTVSRYQLQGTDLGYSFEHQGKIYFLFGDTVGAQGHALDSIAQVDSAAGAVDPEHGVRLDFLTERAGLYLTVQPPGISMGAFEVPTAGISVNNQMYVIVDTNHSEDWQTDRAVLTRVSLPVTATGFKPLRTISQRPDGRFLKMALHMMPEPIRGLPDANQYVLMWGTGHYRHSDVYLAITPAATFETGAGIRYFAGLDAAGAPRWDFNESAAAPVIINGTVGDISVIWNSQLHLWLMTYDSRPPAAAGILFSYSPTPWGPWSTPQLLFNAQRDGALGKFIHDPSISPDDGLAGPTIGKAQLQPETVHGGNYAPYLVERWSRVLLAPAGNGQLDLYYLLSTWNPYVVVLMNSRLRITISQPAGSPH